MLITKDLEYPILYEPALANGMKCNNLKIITGFTGKNYNVVIVTGKNYIDDYNERIDNDPDLGDEYKIKKVDG